MLGLYSLIRFYSFCRELRYFVVPRIDGITPVRFLLGLTCCRTKEEILAHVKPGCGKSLVQFLPKIYPRSLHSRQVHTYSLGDYQACRVGRRTDRRVVVPRWPAPYPTPGDKHTMREAITHCRLQSDFTVSPHFVAGILPWCVNI